VAIDEPAQRGAPLLSGDPGRPQTPTEATVATMMSTGVVRARRTFPTYAVVTFLGLAAVGCAVLGWVWRVTKAGHASGPADVEAELGRISVVGGLALLVVSLVVFAVVASRNWALISSLPVDGSVGPGEVQFRAYEESWRPRGWAQLANCAVIATTLAAMTAAVSSDGGPDLAGIELVLGIGAVVALIAGLAIVRSWHYQGSPLQQSRVESWTPHVDPAPSGRDGILAWTAPVLCGLAPVDASVPFDAARLEEVSRAGYEQNGLVLTESALYAVTVVPPELRALVTFSQVYRDVTTAFFISGTAIRREIGHRLATGGLAALTSDGTSVRIAREQIGGITVMDRTFVVSVVGAEAFAYDFNHADAATAFAAQMAARGVGHLPAEALPHGGVVFGTAADAAYPTATWSPPDWKVSQRGSISLLSLTPWWILPRPYLRSMGPAAPGVIYPWRPEQRSPRQTRRAGLPF
jgi:hypothetical protein